MGNPRAEQLAMWIIPPHSQVVVAGPGEAADCLRSAKPVVRRIEAGERAAGGIAIPAVNAEPATVRAVEHKRVGHQVFN